MGDENGEMRGKTSSKSQESIAKVIKESRDVGSVNLKTGCG